MDPEYTPGHNQRVMIQHNIKVKVGFFNVCKVSTIYALRLLLYPVLSCRFACNSSNK